MNIGLVGAHRTGKTTLAEEVSMNTGMELLLTETSGVVKTLGVDLSKPMSFSERIAMQEAILDAGNRIWSQAAGSFITDRTPIDMLMYTLADIGMSTALSDEDQRLLREYTRKCFELTNFYFDILVLIQPGIALVEDDHKAPLNRAYMDHLNAVAMGLLYDDRIVDCDVYHIKRSYTALSTRTSAILHIIDSVDTKGEISKRISH